MKKFLIVLTAAALLSGASASAQNALPVDPEVRIGKLENGLTYYIRHNDKPAQRADFYLVSNVGAIQEGPGQDGLAHFLEHMCFNGLKNLPGKDMLNYLQRIGASFGANINAGTGVEETSYMLNNMPVTREGIVDTCLLVLHDYSHFVLNDAEEIEKERGVILEEKRTRNTASWRVSEARSPYLFGDTKYATTNIIGSEETLKTFQRPAIVDFYTTWYRPDNQAVIVVGDIDADLIESKLKTLFADVPAPVNPRAKDVITIPANEEPVIGVVTDSELSNNSCLILWRRPAIDERLNNTDQIFALSVVNDLFEQVMSERFNDITSRPDAPFLYAGIGYGNLVESTDALFGSLSFQNGSDTEALKAFFTEVERVKRYGVTEAELQRAKENVLSSLEKAVDGAATRKNPEFIPALISAFTDNTPILTPQIRYELTKAICSQINAAAINTIIPAYITDNNLVVVLQGPSQINHPSEKEILDIVLASRTAEVEAPKAEECNVPLMDSSTLKGAKVRKSGESVCGATLWTLKNGVKVYVLPTEYKKDEVRINLRMNGGESLIPDGDLYSFDENIWSLFLQNSGLAGFSSTELTKVLAGKNASAYPVIDKTWHGISASSSPKDIETAFQLLYLNFTAQRFDKDEYQVGINQINAVLPNLSNNPSFQLGRRMVADIYDNNPRRFFISEEVVEKASLEAIERSYNKLFKDAAGAVVYIVGNVKMDELKPLVEKYIGSLPKGRKALNWVDDGADVRKGEFVDHFEIPMTTPKSTVVQLYSANIPGTVENQVLLNAVSNILFMLYTDTLREEEGGTYGASAKGDFELRPKEVATIQVAFDTNVEQAPKLIEIARKGLTNLAKDGPSEEYFTRTVEHFKNEISHSRISNAYWYNVLSSWVDYGYNADTEKEAVINALTREKIKKFAQEFLSQGNYIEIKMNPAK